MLVHVFAEAVHEDLFGDRFLRVVKDVIGEDERLRHHRLYLFLLLLLYSHQILHLQDKLPRKQKIK